MNIPELYLVEPYNAYAPQGRKKHWMEIVEEQAMLAKIIAEQQAQVEKANLAIPHGQAHGNGCAGAPKLNRPAEVKATAPTQAPSPAPKAQATAPVPTPAPAKPLQEAKQAPVTPKAEEPVKPSQQPAPKAATPTTPTKYGLVDLSPTGSVAKKA